MHVPNGALTPAIYRRSYRYITQRRGTYDCMSGGTIGMEEARYVKVASRFFLAVGKQGNAAAGGGCGDPDRRHFLDACFLCKRDITTHRHIFMYKGDAAFCSDDCRQEQRDMDAALKAARRHHRLLRRTASLPASSSAAACTANKAATTGSRNIAVGR